MTPKTATKILSVLFIIQRIRGSLIAVILSVATVIVSGIAIAVARMFLYVDHRQDNAGKIAPRFKNLLQAKADHFTPGFRPPDDKDRFVGDARQYA